jgi:hypothetical protein
MQIAYNELIEWLESHCHRKKIGKTYKGLELSSEFRQDVERAKKVGMEFFIDPMLPIDLVAVRTKNEQSEDKPGEMLEVHYYTLFWLVSLVEPSAERLQFYRFYLSRICKLRAVRITMVIPVGGDDNLYESLRKIAKENGFGLWKVDTGKKDAERLCIARNFREHMEESIKNPPEDMEPLPKSIKRKAKMVGLYFDRYVGEAVEAVAGRTIAQVGKRYIAREILDLVFELRHISYAKQLKDLVIEHLANKGDDHQFVTNTFSMLWKAYFPKMDYSRFLDIAELPLYNIFATRKRPYRDHHMHQFQVFVLGLAIIDKLLDSQHFDDDKNHDIDKQWLVTSSFHDMAYPLQLYDDWARDFFEKSLEIPNIGVSDIRTYFVDKSLLSSLGFLIDALCQRHFHISLEGNWLHEERELLLFFYDRITRLKHHCILSSLFLLKQAQRLSKSDSLYKIFVPAALAIALHHYGEIWQDLSEPKNPDKVWRQLPEKRKLQSLAFSTDPLTFLLMYCDNAQEWGRPKLKYPEHIDLEEGQAFVLDRCNITASKCSVIINTPQLITTDDRFEIKDGELKTLEKLLRCPVGCEFTITLVDKEGVPRLHKLKCG